MSEVKPVLSSLHMSAPSDIPMLLKMIQEYHEYDHLEFDEALTRTLLDQVISNPGIGRIWMVKVNKEVAGYMLLTFGFSLEFKGRNGLLDEFFLHEKWRGQGLGKQTLRLMQKEAKAMGMKAVHLEVTRDNEKALKLYEKVDFKDNERFLMTCWLP
jgi:ribosomal protein S18 acetylase RimI-like enzyme